MRSDTSSKNCRGRRDIVVGYAVVVYKPRLMFDVGCDVTYACCELRQILEEGVTASFYSVRMFHVNKTEKTLCRVRICYPNFLSTLR